jgi:phosphoserine phosphatase
VPTLVGGRTEAEARALAERTLRVRKLAVRGAMGELLGALVAAGWDVWVVSASAEVLVRAALAGLPVRPDRFLGMRLPLVDGRYGREVERPYPWREGKVEALRAASVTPTFAVGDSQGDLPMMHLAGRALLVDRGSVEVRDRARAAGFWIQPEADLLDPDVDPDAAPALSPSD